MIVGNLVFLSALFNYQVCLRSCPLYHPGSIGFNISSGIPLMGQLMESAWNLDEKCRFKVLPLANDKPPCNPPAIEEQETDVPVSLGLSKFPIFMNFIFNLIISWHHI